MAWRLAARAALPVDDPVGGRRIVAELLYREATLRSLCAILGCETPGALTNALAGFSVDEVASRTGGSQSAVAVQQLFGDERSQQQFRASASEGSSMAEVAVPLRDLAEGLVKRAGRHVHASGRLLVKITLRWLLVVTGAAALVALSPLSRLWNRENILATASWHAIADRRGQSKGLLRVSRHTLGRGNQHRSAVVDGGGQAGGGFQSVGG